MPHPTRTQIKIASSGIDPNGAVIEFIRKDNNELAGAMRNHIHPHYQQQKDELAYRSFVESHLEPTKHEEKCKRIGYDFMSNRYLVSDHISQDVGSSKSRKLQYVNSLPRHAGFPVGDNNTPTEIRQHVNAAIKQLTDPLIDKNFQPSANKPWNVEKERWRLLAGIPTRDEFPYKPNIQWAPHEAPLRSQGGVFFPDSTSSSVRSSKSTSTAATSSTSNRKRPPLFEFGDAGVGESENASLFKSREARIGARLDRKEGKEIIQNLKKDLSSALSPHNSTNTKSFAPRTKNKKLPAGMMTAPPMSKEGRLVYNPITHEASVFKTHQTDGMPVLVSKYTAEASQSVMPLVGSPDHHGKHARIRDASTQNSGNKVALPAYDPIGFRITKGVSELKDMANPFLGNYNPDHVGQSFKMKQGDFAKHFDAGIRCGMQPI
eukprot:GDKJ01051655.1.p1 GENE.GDKJ01051655.1~~GDKJ01051655.1.p1  ORF type:complete len:433 (-),score=86.89 GDKJ01051655.1:322-1620(-)